MRTLNRDYRKNPHTATFLNTFHSGMSSTSVRENAKRVLAEALAAGVDGRDGRDDSAALALESAQDDDLLNLVPANDVVDLRSTAQVKFMNDLIARITILDAEAGEQARAYTEGKTERGTWTPGRGGNISDWIDRMIAKERALKASASGAVRPAVAPQVADGRYAVEEDGVLKFFRVKNGNRPGFVFLDVQASDDWHAIRNVARIHQVLTLITTDSKAAMIRYGQELGQCGRCGRTLTSEYRKAGLGPVCIDK